MACCLPGKASSISKTTNGRTIIPSIDENGITFADKQYSKAYLRHLIISGEMLGAQIASIHNLGFYLWLVGEAREKILTGEFSTWKDKMVKQLSTRL